MSQPRQAAGTPSGGQFAGVHHDESSNELTDAVTDGAGANGANGANGMVSKRSDLLRALNYSPTSVEEVDELFDAYTDACRYKPMSPQEFAYRNPDRFGFRAAPAPPNGTVIDHDWARAIQSYTVIEARFGLDPDRSMRLMARDQACWAGKDDNRLRRFTNLDSGIEMFVGSDQGDGATIVSARVIEQP